MWIENNFLNGKGQVYMQWHNSTFCFSNRVNLTLAELHGVTARLPPVSELTSLKLLFRSVWYTPVKLFHDQMPCRVLCPSTDLVSVHGFDLRCVPFHTCAWQEFGSEGLTVWGIDSVCWILITCSTEKYCQRLKAPQDSGMHCQRWVQIKFNYCHYLLKVQKLKKPSSYISSGRWGWRLHLFVQYMV